MNRLTATDVVTVVSTARPKRVAILVDADAITGAEVDHITQSATTYWGGGFWPLIPCDGNALSDDWWALLEAVDPDIVLSVGAMSDELFTQIHRRIAPSRLILHGAVAETRHNGVL